MEAHRRMNPGNIAHMMHVTTLCMLQHYVCVLGGVIRGCLQRLSSAGVFNGCLQQMSSTGVFNGCLQLVSSTCVFNGCIQRVSSAGVFNGCLQRMSSTVGASGPKVFWRINTFLTCDFFGVCRLLVFSCETHVGCWLFRVGSVWGVGFFVLDPCGIYF